LDKWGKLLKTYIKLEDVRAGDALDAELVGKDLDVVAGGGIVGALGKTSLQLCTGVLE